MQRARCKYRVARSGALLEVLAPLAGPTRDCATRPFRWQQRAAAPHCAAVLLGAVRVLALFLLRDEMRPVARPPFLAQPTGLSHPIPKQLQARSPGDQVRGRFPLCTPPLSRSVPGTACDRVGAGLGQDWRSARRSFTPSATAHALQGGHQLARTGTSALLWRPAALAGYHLSKL